VRVTANTLRLKEGPGLLPTRSVEGIIFGIVASGERSLKDKEPKLWSKSPEANAENKPTARLDDGA